MTKLWEHTYEGWADEADLSTGGSGSGSPWSSAPSKTGAATVKADTAKFMHGALSGRYSRVTGTDTAYQQNILISSVTRLQARFYVWVTNLPSVQMNLCTFRSATAFMGYLGISASGKLQMYNRNNTGVASSAAVANFPVAQWVRVEGAIKAGTTGTAPASTDGVMEWAYYLGDSATAVETKAPISTIDTGLVAPQGFRLGPQVVGTDTAAFGDYWFDDPAQGDGAAGWLGPSSIDPPVIVLNTDQNFFRADFRGSGVSSGTITYTISQDSGPTVTVDEPVDGLFFIQRHATTDGVYTVTATGSLGGSDTEQFTVPHQSSGSTTGQVVRLKRVGGAFS